MEMDWNFPGDDTMFFERYKDNSFLQFARGEDVVKAIGAFYIYFLPDKRKA